MFWGIVVKPGKTGAFVPPPDGSRLHLSQACVAGTPKSGERVSLLLKSGDEDEEGQFKVAGFIGLQSETIGLDLVLESYAEFSVDGKHPVHLTGYLMPDYDEDGEGDDGMMYPGMEDDDSEDDEDDEDEDSDEGGVELTPQEKKALQKMINGGSVKIEELDVRKPDLSMFRACLATPVPVHLLSERGSSVHECESIPAQQKALRPCHPTQDTGNVKEEDDDEDEDEEDDEEMDEDEDDEDEEEAAPPPQEDDDEDEDDEDEDDEDEDDEEEEDEEEEEEEEAAPPPQKKAKADRCRLCCIFRIR